MEKTDITIIGAGVIGLGIAAELSSKNKSIFILEKASSFGTETSSRNSEVIHAGIYYPKDSLKAKTCLEGNRMLYKICEKNNIPHRKIGKLIIARDMSEIEYLEKLFQNAKDNDLRDIDIISEDKIKSLEPNIKAEKAIFSRSTGVIDSHALMKYFIFKAKDKGAQVSFNSEVKDIKKESGGYSITIIDSDNKPFTFLSSIVINCAGLNADIIAKAVGIDIEKEDYVLKYSKGQYFKITGKKSNLVKRLIYPVPTNGSNSLGIHTTPNLAGTVRIGPDDRYISRDEVNYDIDLDDKDKFYESTVSFLPFLDREDLSPDTAGIRPKLQGEREGFRDFVIKEESALGYPGFVNLIGIESPGLTAAPAIAKYVAKIC